MQPVKKILAYAARLGSYLTAVNPLIYVALYSGAIPLFALLYYNVPQGFHAPYSRYEKAAKEDAVNLSRVLTSSIRDMACAQDNAVCIGDCKVDCDSFRVYDLKSEGGGAVVFRFAFSVAESRKTVIFGGVSLRMPAAETLMTIKDGLRQYYYALDYYDANYPAELKAYYSKFLDVIFDTKKLLAPGITLDQESQKKFEAYVLGEQGDALGFSGGYGRMLYFSIVVITTLGFGDIVPISNAARFLVGCEAFSGIILIGLFLNSLTRNRCE